MADREIETVTVQLAERSYQIAVGTQLLERAAEFVRRHRAVAHAVVVTDENVENPHAACVAESLAAADVTVDMVVVPAGELTKSVDSAAALWEKFLELQADRKSVVVAVGGGVVGDLAGFVAATFARGLRFFQAPTSLLAQVDSSVGGKVGVNLPAAKNMVGAFHQPIGVLIDVDSLETLPEREYRSGLGEVVKYGVILDAEFFAFLEEHAAAIAQRHAPVLRHVVARCCRLKADVVEQDEREESGLRAILNYGHTFAHAFEALTGYGALLHGEAVAMGMICASRLAERLGMVPAEVTARQQQLLEQLGLPTAMPELDPDEVLRIMAHDKKTETGRLRLILPRRIGQVEMVADVPPDSIRQVIAS